MLVDLLIVCLVFAIAIANLAVGFVAASFFGRGPWVRATLKLFSKELTGIGTGQLDAGRQRPAAADESP